MICPGFKVSKKQKEKKTLLQVGFIYSLVL